MKYFLLLTIILFGCGRNVFKSKKTPHASYAEQLTNAGLHQTAMGRAWFDASKKALRSPLKITLPHSENGFFPANAVAAAGYMFNAKRGEKITIRLQKKPSTGAKIYTEIWDALAIAADDGPLEFADTTTSSIEFEVEKAGDYILRLQPELLKSIEYSLQISAGPSLAFPVKHKDARVQSFWGAERDGGARSHEGIDIFAPRGTPLIAAAPGRVSRVNENNLGGKVVWLRPTGRNYTLYYAHLDKQLVQDGDMVKVGDTIGLVGNTGNAISTKPHLHFGIYSTGGAIDPYPFVKPDSEKPPILSEKIMTWSLYRTLKELNESGNKILKNSLVIVTAVSSDGYKTRLPDDREMYISRANLTAANRPIITEKRGGNFALYATPTENALIVKTITGPAELPVLGSFNGFIYVKNSIDSGWIRSHQSL